MIQRVITPFITQHKTKPKLEKVDFHRNGDTILLHVLGVLG
jgi:hypothetical protein